MRVKSWKGILITLFNPYLTEEYVKRVTIFEFRLGRNFCNELVLKSIK